MNLPNAYMPEAVTLTPQTLDALWHEAEQLGRVKVERDIHNTAYEAQIAFRRKSGTRIYAEAKDSSVHVALAKAINEAREMGA